MLDGVQLAVLVAGVVDERKAVIGVHTLTARKGRQRLDRSSSPPMELGGLVIVLPSEKCVRLRGCTEPDAPIRVKLAMNWP